MTSSKKVSKKKLDKNIRKVGEWILNPLDADLFSDGEFDEDCVKGTESFNKSNITNAVRIGAATMAATICSIIEDDEVPSKKNVLRLLLEMCLLAELNIPALSIPFVSVDDQFIERLTKELEQNE